MTRAPVVIVLCLLAGCDHSQALSVDALAADPTRLHTLVAQCRRGEHDGAFCAQVTQANVQRFFSGHAGPDEYQTLADLPPILATFDGPVPTTSEGETP